MKTRALIILSLVLAFTPVWAQAVQEQVQEEYAIKSTQDTILSSQELLVKKSKEEQQVRKERLEEIQKEAIKRQEERVVQNENRKQQLKERKQYVKQRKQDLDKRKAELKQRKRDLEKRKVTLQDQGEQNKERIKQIEKRQEKLTERQRELDERQEELVQYELELDEREEKIEKRGFEIELRTKELDLKNVYRNDGRLRINKSYILEEKNQFTKNSKDELYSFELEKSDSRSILIFVYCNLNMGSAHIKIYTPQGKIYDSLEIKSQGNDDDSNGVLIKTVQQPQEGKWEIKVEKKEATGRLELKTTLIEAVD